jgi:hypothetical protein
LERKGAEGWKGRGEREEMPEGRKGKRKRGKRLAAGRKEGKEGAWGRKEEEGRRFWVSPLTRNVLQLYSIFSEILGCHGGY